MLVKGVNDNKREIKLFKSIISETVFDKIQLNTVVRPPGDANAAPLSIKELKNIRELIKRRPVTLSDISTSLDINRNETVKYLDILKRNDIIKILNFEGKQYFESK